MNKRQVIIKYADLWGLREEKYDFLNSHDVKNTIWKDVTVEEPNYFFIPRETKGEEEYQKFTSLQDIFMNSIIGVATGKDKVLVSQSPQQLKMTFSNRDKELFSTLMQNLKVSKDVIKAWQKELDSSDISTQITPYLYRPFDKRYTIYSKKILQRARDSIMKNLLKENIGLICMKSIKKDLITYFFITDSITDRHVLDLSADAAYVFPLYLYNQGEDISKPNLFLHEVGSNKTHNLKDDFIGTINIMFAGKALNFETIFYYIYGILYSNTYREKYNEFLKIDFPRIPVTKDYDLFIQVSKLGKELADLHLLKSAKLDKSIAKFKGEGDNKIEKIDFFAMHEGEGKNLSVHGDVWINEKQHFDGVNEFLWNYYIGGYQVLKKWLKDRKGETLSTEEVDHFLKVVTTIYHTILLQKEIDKLYPKVEKSLIKF